MQQWGELARCHHGGGGGTTFVRSPLARSAGLVQLFSNVGAAAFLPFRPFFFSVTRLRQGLEGAYWGLMKLISAQKKSWQKPLYCQIFAPGQPFLSLSPVEFGHRAAALFHTPYSMRTEQSVCLRTPEWQCSKSLF